MKYGARVFVSFADDSIRLARILRANRSKLKTSFLLTCSI